MEGDIVRTINETIEDFKTYEARQKDIKLRKQRTSALVKAITAATNHVIDNELVSQEFLFDSEGIKELTFTESGKYETPDSYIIKYENFMSISELEMGYTIDEIKDKYPTTNFRFGYHHFGYSLKISINV